MKTQVCPTEPKPIAVSLRKGLEPGTNPEAKNVGWILLKNVRFTIKTLNFPFSFGTLWPSCGSDLWILRPLASWFI